jgi:hypothetical protein
LRAESIEDFEERLLRLSRDTQLPLGTVPVLLSDISGVLMQEARRTLFEERDEVAFDARSVREELLRMGHDGSLLGLKQVRLLLDFFLDQVVDSRATRN